VRVVSELAARQSPLRVTPPECLMSPSTWRTAVESIPLEQARLTLRHTPLLLADLAAPKLFSDQ
jgi:hypothetical protein